MSVENLINLVRLGKQLTPAQSRAVSAQLERIPAMERAIAAKDRDFTQLSVAYTSAVEARSAKCVQFTSDECGYVCDALEECERLKEAVLWERECRTQGRGKSAVSATTATNKAASFPARLFYGKLSGGR